MPTVGDTEPLAVLDPVVVGVSLGDLDCVGVTEAVAVFVPDALTLLVRLPDTDVVAVCDTAADGLDDLLSDALSLAELESDVDADTDDDAVTDSVRDSDTE